MKIEIEGIIHVQRSEYSNALRWDFFSCDMSSYGHIPVAPYTLVFDVPEDFKPVPAEIEMLRKKMKEIRAEAQVRCNAINEQIGKLLALEYKE